MRYLFADDEVTGLNVKVHNGLTLYGFFKDWEYKSRSLGDTDELFKLSDDDWDVSADYIRTVKPAEFVELPSGTYRIVVVQHTNYFAVFDNIVNDDIVSFSIVNELIEDFDNFLNAKEIYNNLNLTYKKGYLLWGPPGTGKTTIIRKLLTDFKPKDAIVIFIERAMSLDLINILREDPRLKIIVFEELVDTIRYESVGKVLSFLDGQLSFNNCIIIATTNNPEDLPKNIVRPGRFDKQFKIAFLSQTDIQKYSEHFLKRQLTKDELEAVGETTIASLKEIFLRHLRDDVAFEKACLGVREQAKLVLKEFNDTGGSIGFTADDEDDDD